MSERKTLKPAGPIPQTSSIEEPRPKTLKPSPLPTGKLRLVSVARESPGGRRKRKGERSASNFAQHLDIVHWAKPRAEVVGYVSSTERAEEVDRPELDYLTVQIERGEVDGIAVRCLRRLGTGLAQITIRQRIEAAGGIVRSTRESEDRVLCLPLDDPGRESALWRIAADDAYERRVSNERLQEGRRRHIAAGGFGGGPFRERLGDRVVIGADGVGVWVPKPEGRAVEQRILAERERGLSYRAICARLMADGIPAPAGGSTWHPGAVQRVLRTVRARQRNMSTSALG